MADQKQRSVDEIRNDYSQTCAKLGHAEYQLYVIGKDVEMIKKTLEDLNFEAAAANAAEAKAKEAAAQEASAATPQQEVAANV